MVCKPINLINAKLEDMYYGNAMFWFYTTIQATVFDAIILYSLSRAFPSGDIYDSKGKMPSISSQEGLPTDHDIPLARYVLNKLLDYPALLVLSNEI
jgi:hypothetical protein